ALAKPSAAAACDTRAGRANDSHPLYRPVDPRRIAVLRLRPRSLGQGLQCRSGPVGHRRLCRADGDGGLVVSTLSLRPDGMALACRYAHNASGAISHLRLSRKKVGISQISHVLPNLSRRSGQAPRNCPLQSPPALAYWTSTSRARARVKTLALLTPLPRQDF